MSIKMFLETAYNNVPMHTWTIKMNIEKLHLSSS